MYQVAIAVASILPGSLLVHAGTATMSYLFTQLPARLLICLHGCCAGSRGT